MLVCFFQLFFFYFCFIESEKKKEKKKKIKDCILFFFMIRSGGGGRGWEIFNTPTTQCDYINIKACVMREERASTPPHTLTPSANRNKRKINFLFWKQKKTLDQVCSDNFYTVGAPCAFKDSMIHWVVQFALRIAFRSVLHRYTSREIHRWKLWISFVCLFFKQIRI